MENNNSSMFQIAIVSLLCIRFFNKFAENLENTLNKYFKINDSHGFLMVGLWSVLKFSSFFD